MKKNLLTFAVLSFFAILLLPVGKAIALSGSDFKAGNIIDNVVFYDSLTLKASDVQKFLSAKVPTCDTNGAQSKSYYYNSSTGRINNSADTWVTTSRATYGARYDKWYKTTIAAAPYTCLKDYKQNTPAMAAESGICGNLPAYSGRTAAQIISDVSSACGVNPEVLIVLLQKEQGLVTDDWPWANEYQKAAGFACPDTTGCDSTYYGYFNQVYHAARQFKRYQADPTNWNYVAGQNNKIYYNPNSNCGYSWVYIQNQATAGLYDYTPYQPNQAALNNLYGSGDSCSAYGNRNFWRYFNDWFGSVRAPSYSATYYSQSSYPTISPGSTSSAYLSYKNTGNAAWYDNTSLSSAPAGTKPVHLATTNPINRSSKFNDGTWGSDNNRPAFNFAAVYEADGTTLAANQDVVQPGQIAKFSFTLSVPSSLAPGTYREYFQPVLEGSSDYQFSDPHTWLDITVPTVYKSSFVTQSAYPSLLAGQGSDAYLTFKNEGNVPWYDDTSVPKNGHPVHLVTANPLNRSSDFSGGKWGSGNNIPARTFSVVYHSDGTPYSSNPHIVKPGESVKFVFKFVVPDNYAAGTYRETFQPVVDGGSAIATSPMNPWLDVTVQSGPSAKAVQASQSVTINPGTSKSFTYSFKNTGNTTWSQSSTQLEVVDGDASDLNNGSWQSNTILANLNESSVAPGATGTFTVAYAAPLKKASYSFKLSAFINGTDIGLTTSDVKISVPTPSYTAHYYTESSFPTMVQGSESHNLYFSFTNTGNTPWYDNTSVSSAPAGSHPVHLAATHPINRSSKFDLGWPSANRPAVNFSAVYEADGKTLAPNQHVVLPGEVAKFGFDMSTPMSLASGTYREYFQPIVEGGSPWDMGQIAWLDVTVKQAVYEAAYKSESVFPTIPKGSQASAFFSFKNEGNIAWYDNSSVASAPAGTHPIHLATTHPINRSSRFSSAWPSSNRPTYVLAAVYESDGTTLSANQHRVDPGQIGKFSFTLSAPSGIASGTYREYFQPIVEGGSPWDMGQIAWLDVTVP